MGFVPLSKTAAERLSEMISRYYERGATLITSNLPFDGWTETFGTERLTGRRPSPTSRSNPKWHGFASPRGPILLCR